MMLRQLSRRHALWLMGGTTVGLVGGMLQAGSSSLSETNDTPEDLGFAVAKPEAPTPNVPIPPGLRAIEIQLGHHFTLNVADPKNRMIYLDDWLSGEDLCLQITRGPPATRYDLKFYLEPFPWDRKYVQLKSFLDRWKPGYGLRVFFTPQQGEKSVSLVVPVLGVTAVTHWNPDNNLSRILLQVPVSKETAHWLLDLSLAPEPPRPGVDQPKGGIARV